jgi:plasmid stability protein
MGTLIVRNLDDDLIAKLKLRAARNKRSTEAEHRELLRQVLSTEPRQSFKEIAAKLRAMTANRAHTPAEVLVREGRDER